MARVMVALQSCAGWLASLLFDSQLRLANEASARARHLHDLTLTTLLAPDFEQASLAAVNALARLFDASLVQLGWISSHAARILVRSNAAWLETASNQMNLAAQAMNEAYDRDETMTWVDGRDEAAAAMHSAHRAYGRAVDSAALLTLPLRYEGKVNAVVLMERQKAFSPDEVDLANAAAILLAPALVIKKRASEPVFSHARRSAAVALSS